MKTVYWEGDVRVTKERFYPISELSRDAQETAWQNWLEYADYPWSKENRESLDRFSEIFGVTVTDWEYGYRYNIRYLTPDWDMYSLKGVRLWKYLVNNGYADMINDTCPLTVNVNPKGDHRANQNGTHPEHHARHWSPAPSGAGRDNSDISQPTAHATAASRGIGTTPR